MHHAPFIAATRTDADAAALIDLFGDDAGVEAAARADRSRSVGNYLHFCRWRQVGRLIALLTNDQATGTIH